MAAKSSGLIRIMPSSPGGASFCCRSSISRLLASEDAVPPYRRDCEGALTSAVAASSPVLRDCDCNTALATDLNPEAFPIGLFWLKDVGGVPAEVVEGNSQASATACADQAVSVPAHTAFQTALEGRSAYDTYPTGLPLETS